jgi:hypothetical protein
MSDQTCPNCVALFKVHRPTNWARCLFLASTIFLISFVLLVTILQNIAMMVMMASPLCFVFYGVLHFTLYSRFLVGYDSAGYLHLHKRNKPIMDARLVLEVRAGAIPHRCKLHGDNPHNWKVIANNEHFFFADSSGDIFSVRYCGKPHHAATGYLSHDVRILSDALLLIKQRRDVEEIRRLALQQTQSSVEDCPVAGSISANQG